MHETIGALPFTYHPPSEADFVQFLEVSDLKTLGKFFKLVPVQKRSIRTCAAILAAASDLARQKGSESLNILNISALSGVSQPGIYRYFYSIRQILDCSYHGLLQQLWARRLIFIRQFPDITLREACSIYCYSFVIQTSDAIGDYMKTHLYGDKMDLFLPGHELLARHLHTVARRRGMALAGDSATFSVPSVALALYFREQWEKHQDLGYIRAHWRSMATFYEDVQHAHLAMRAPHGLHLGS